MASSCGEAPWASHGIALGHLDVWMPWISSMASSCGETPWASHGIALGHLDVWMPWISSMASSCGETPWASHGIALGALGCVDALDIFHGKLMWRSTMGIPWNCIGGSWMGGCH